MEYLTTKELIEATGTTHKTLRVLESAGAVMPDRGQRSLRWPIQAALAVAHGERWRTWGCNPTLFQAAVRSVAEMDTGKMLREFARGNTALQGVPGSKLRVPLRKLPQTPAVPADAEMKMEYETVAIGKFKLKIPVGFTFSAPGPPTAGQIASDDALFELKAPYDGLLVKLAEIRKRPKPRRGRPPMTTKAKPKKARK